MFGATIKGTYTECFFQSSKGEKQGERRGMADNYIPMEPFLMKIIVKNAGEWCGTTLYSVKYVVNKC